MAISNIVKATIQMRKGLEQDFDPDQMTVGEWAVSEDTKYVRMCFAPGVCLRMATYESFEEDMKEIQTILTTCQDIQVAVDAMVELAEQHKDAAAASAEAAKASETSAVTAAESASASALNASNYAESAALSETNAKASESATSLSEANAKLSETNSASSEKLAKSYSESANDSKTEAALYAENASASETTATKKAEESFNYSNISKSYAVGTGGETRENDDTDCSEYYYEQCKRISQSLNGVIPMGTIAFDDLADPNNQQSGYMFNISDSFTSDDRFKDGGGILYGSGNNVLYTADGMWDVLAASAVSGVKGEAENEYRQGFVNITKANVGLDKVPNVATNDQTPTFTEATTRENLTSGEKLSISLGKIMKFFTDLKSVAFSGNYLDLSNTPTIPAAVAVKGNAETKYRTGNVNLTAANIGAVATDGDTADNTVTFTSGDSTSPTAWTDVEALVTGEKHSSLLNKISTMIKNVRWLYKMLGKTDISGIGDGTVTGAISTQNSNLNTANLKLNLGGNVTSVRFATLKASGLGNIRFIYADGSCHLLNITTSGLEYKYVDANGNENTLWSK